MIQRHQSISGRGSLSGGGGGASAAAAAAAATAATATAYTHISSKLEGIEGLISALKVRVCVLVNYQLPPLPTNNCREHRVRFHCFDGFASFARARLLTKEISAPVVQRSVHPTLCSEKYVPSM